jgi:hypothetical protein
MENWRINMTKLLTTAAMLAALTVSAQAATFNVNPNTCNKKEEGCTVIHIVGRIEANDGGKFMEIILKDQPKKVLVSLNSEGGNLVASLQIGRFIKTYGYNTMVTTGSVCVSGCAMIWLAGNYKYASEEARIGFHAAYTIEQKGKQTYTRESGQGNAIVGAYYAELGFGEDAIRYFTAAAPTSASWLNQGVIKQLGLQKIEVYKPEKKS